MSAIEQANGVFLRNFLERVVAFQEHRLRAWDESATFYDRIADLPLYALEFNNCDRNPKKHGPTIAHYSPARREVRALVKLCNKLGPDITVVDVGCGNGFVGSLLAREGVRVIGIDDLSWNAPQIASFYDPEVYELKAPCCFDEYSGPCDVALCSWQVPGVNLTEQILSRHPRLVIHIYSPDLQSDGTPTTGSKAAYQIPSDYRRIGQWGVVSPPNFFHGIDARYTRNGRTTRVVECWARDDMPEFGAMELDSVDVEYKWQLDRDGLNSIRAQLGLETYDIPTRE
jgi:hypothetical protein